MPMSPPCSVHRWAQKGLETGLRTIESSNCGLNGLYGRPNAFAENEGPSTFAYKIKNADWENWYTVF